MAEVAVDESVDLDARYQLRSFPAEEQGHPGYERCVSWIRAVGQGFYDARRTEEQIAGTLHRAAVDQRLLTGIYELNAPAMVRPEQPVATFGTLVKDLNVGQGRMLPTLLITAVTVRTDHRRRGLLSQMMRRRLRQAKEAGLAMAALTASEASIYRRFGFGVATFERSVTQKTGRSFSLDHRAQGTVRAVPVDLLPEFTADIFARVHQQQTGSVDRQEAYRLRSVGLDRGQDTNDKVLAAVHYDADGAADGYVSYQHAGWDASPLRLDVIDFIALGSARLDLWQYLASADLVEEIRWSEASQLEGVEWALADRRTMRTTGMQDMLWLRILDVKTALESRPYPEDGRLVLEVVDPMGLTGGIVAVDIRNGHATVRPTDDAPMLRLDVADLASLYLGSVPPTALQAAGRLEESVPGSVNLAQRLLAAEGSVHCFTHF
ncbi:GNAT family N-acetyltransferase [Psychromicrobium xiongbiense]|uniref:GNAT family N-acetyltransferase n=1 Tax=Psychromicrobium xiongbiense TaxID=3051184 RepID=UPI0025573C06|nr:GNAT family N-acetyltransferase [Psychromicrobium sp. YIM S02556]